MSKWFYLALGSLLGGFARYSLAGLIYERLGTAFPHGTLMVNLSGCFLIGLFNSLAETKFLLGPDAKILLMTGFCGAYTTFSTLMLETSNLFRDGEIIRGILNVLASLILGFVLFRIGSVFGELV